MPRVIVTIDGAVTHDIALIKDRTTLGRRPYNDIVLDNLTVSGEHAALVLSGGQVVLEDLNSTNGTFVNGKPIKKQALRHGDTLEVGKCKISFESDAGDDAFEKTMLVKARPPSVLTAGATVAALPLRGVIKVLSGAAAGREMPLTKVVTTVGKPGVAVAAITRRPHHFAVHHVEGVEPMTLNGQAVGVEPVVLRDGDQIVLAGTQMQFLQPL